MGRDFLSVNFAPKGYGKILQKNHTYPIAKNIQFWYYTRA